MKSNHTQKLKCIGKKIANLRKSKGLNQEELAIKASISYSYLTKIEAPNCDVSYSIETLFDLADALDVEPKELL